MPEPGGAAHPPNVILAFDFGARNIGVACGDTVSRNASPLSPVPARGGEPNWALIEAHVRTWRPNRLVVGLPYNTDGSESDMTKAARAFAGELQERFALEVDLVDERYSSMDAQARLRSERESGARRRRVGKADIDAVAACVILERWFSERL
jgi:putative Holliday junction resolvase